jgi:hypothetical protein
MRGRERGGGEREGERETEREREGERERATPSGPRAAGPSAQNARDCPELIDVTFGEMPRWYPEIDRRVQKNVGPSLSALFRP